MVASIADARTTRAPTRPQRAVHPRCRCRSASSSGVAEPRWRPGAPLRAAPGILGHARAPRDRARCSSGAGSVASASPVGWPESTQLPTDTPLIVQWGRDGGRPGSPCARRSMPATCPRRRDGCAPALQLRICAASWAMARDEDLGAEAFAQLGEDRGSRLAAFRWEGSLRSWCYALARNALHRLRRDPCRSPARNVGLTEVERLAAEQRTPTCDLSARPTSRTSSARCVHSSIPTTTGSCCSGSIARCRGRTSRVARRVARQTPATSRATRCASSSSGV